MTIQNAHQAVLLNVDTAENSGWATYILGELTDWGEVNALEDLERVISICRSNVVVANKMSLPSVLVFEMPFRGTFQGGYRGVWRASWLQAGGLKSRCVGVHPSTWRTKVLGDGTASLGRDAVRRYEQTMARGIAGLKTDDPPIGGDAAAAICIGCWACTAPQVGKKLPRAARRE